MGKVGTNRAGQAGVQSVDPSKCIWDAAILPAPAADTYITQGKERRQHRRVPCKLGAELYLQDSETVVRVSVTDISVGGCFVAMPTLPADKSRVKIVVWANAVKLHVQGVVISRRPGFGISIKFLELTNEVRDQLQRLIQSLL